MTYRNGMPFAFWCHKVLPLVYDESLSYYEFLCKIAKILQEVMEHDVKQDESIEQNRVAIQEINTGLDGIRSDIAEIQRINRLQELAITGNTDDIGRLGDDIAEQYDESESYDNGDFAMLGKELYKKIRSTGVFDDDWVKVNITDELLSMGASIRNLSDDIDSIENNINDIFGCIANEYDSDEVYYEGNVVRYDGDIYVCAPVSTSTTGTFNPNDWNSTNLGNLIGELNEKTEVLTGRIQGVSGRVDDVLACIAPYYDENTSYNVGDFCTYLDHFWQCVSATSGAFNNSDWVDVSVVDVMGSGGGGSEDVVPPYDPTKYYAIYELMKRNSTTYMCITHNVTVGTFVPSEWFEIPVKDVLRWSVFNAIGYNGLFDPNDTYPKGKLFGELFTDTQGRQCVSVSKVLVDWDGQDTPISDATSLVEIMNESLSVMSNYNRDTYDATKIYNVGDLIIDYTGRCMKCNTNGTTGVFDILKWDSTNMFAELAELKNAVLNMNLYNGNVTNRYHTTVTEGV